MSVNLKIFFLPFLSQVWPYLNNFFVCFLCCFNDISLDLHSWNKEHDLEWKESSVCVVFHSSHWKSNSAGIYWAGYCRNMRYCVTRHCRTGWITCFCAKHCSIDLRAQGLDSYFLLATVMIFSAKSKEKKEYKTLTFK